MVEHSPKILSHEDKATQTCTMIFNRLFESSNWYTRIALFYLFIFRIQKKKKKNRLSQFLLCEVAVYLFFQTEGSLVP